MGETRGDTGGGKSRGGSLQSLPSLQTQIEQIVMASEQELAEAFKLFDSDGDGIITSEELRALIEKVGGTMTEGEAVALIHKADKDGNKGIDQSEFAELWNALHGGGEAEAKIREEFSKLDTDKSGYISKDEMLTVISGSFTGDKQAEAQRCVAELDVDKDGKVSYPEFLLVMKYKKA